MENHIINKFSKLWIETLQRDEEIILNIASSSQQGVLSICITDEDRKLPSNGDMTIYDYNYDKKEVSHIKQDEFIARYCDGNKNVGQTVINLLKIRLNNADRDFMGNEWVDKLKKDNDKRYFVLISEKSNIYIVIGININKNYVEQLINSDLSQFVNLKITDTKERFKVESPENGYPLFNLRYLTKITEDEGKEICKSFLEELKKHNQKLPNSASIKYGMSLYLEYSDFVDSINEEIDNLKNDILRYTDNGTVIKKTKYRTDEDNKILSDFRERESKIDKLSSLNSYNNKSTYAKYNNLIIEMEKMTRDMKNWSPTTSYKGNSCDLSVDYSDVSEMNISGIQHTFIHRKDDINTLRQFIEDGKALGENKFYVTYEDEFGNTSVDKTRLFFNGGVAEFRKGSSKHGHFIDNNWIRIDYFER